MVSGGLRLIRVGLALGASWLGSVSYYRNLLNAISSLPDRQIEPVLLLGERADAGVLEGLPPVEVIRSRWLDPLTPHWAIRKVWQQTSASDPFLERFLRAHHIDVLSHSDFLGRHAALPAICWIGDFQHLELPQYFTKAERLYRDRDFRLQCRHATRILLSSHDAQRTLATFDPACVAKSRVLQFVAQPDLGEETPELATLRERYGFEDPYFHVPNQFWAHKNHRLILDALALLKGRGQPVLVISTGATEDYRQPRYFEQLMADADVLAVHDSFRVLGVVPQADLVGLMTHAIALINPSRAEGWSTSVEEAKSLGKRIILSDIPVHREQAPRDGVYVDPDDPAGLAEAMRQALTTYDAVAERERSSRARRELPDRIRAFAESYQEIVLDVLEASERSIGDTPNSTVAQGAVTQFAPAWDALSKCPRCGGALRTPSAASRCDACHWTGEVVAGVPVLLPDPTRAEHDDLGHDHTHGHKAAQMAHFDLSDEEAFETRRPHGTPRLYRFLLAEKFRRAAAPIGSRLVGATALAVCGGSGMDAEYLSRAGASVISSDLSLGAATRAKTRSAERRLGFFSIVADVEQLPFADRSFDLVAVHDGLHHLDDPYAGLSEMARVAGCWVMVTEPARASITRLAVRLGLATEVEEAGNRVARMNPSEVAAFLEARGYVVLHAGRYAMYYPHHPGRVFRLLSLPLIFPLTRLSWRLGDALLGRFGNKMVVVAQRSQPALADSTSPSAPSPIRSTT
jgi:glycosyltransferase involved in cell wall biosynthesis/SAM-dependent methyltransferase